MRVTPSESDNLLRWDGKSAGFYEVYFVEVQDAAHNTGLWLRYTVRVPKKPNGVEPIAEVWGMYFDRRDPEKNFALKQTVPFALARIERERLFFSAAGCELTHSGCRGAIAKDGKQLEWDLAWDESPRLVHFPYEAMYSRAVPKTKVLSPHFDLRASGSYSAHGERYALSKEPGQQSHLWGTEHADRWIWAHANTFAEDPSAVFEGLTAEVKLGPLVRPRATMFALRYKGVDYVFNRPSQMLRSNESRTDAASNPKQYFPVARWIVGGGNDQLRFRGELWSDLSHYIGVRYTDPDGSGRVCAHSKVASAKLEILARDKSTWRVVDTLTSDGAVALEFVGREADPRVRLLL